LNNLFDFKTLIEFNLGYIGVGTMGVENEYLSYWMVMIYGLLFQSGRGYNVDVTKVGIARGDPHIQFGYSVAIVKTRNNTDRSVALAFLVHAVYVMFTN